MSGRLTVECRTRLRGVAVFIGLLCGVAGCDAPAPTETTSDQENRFQPSPVQAEAALTAVFDAWQAGHPPGMVPETSSPAVHVTDTFRKPGEQLVDYEILGEVPGDGPRCYAVDLRFQPERVERVRFTVSGIDPLWVFRLEDAQLLAHWEHNMEQPGAEHGPTAEAGATDPAPQEEGTAAPSDAGTPTSRPVSEPVPADDSAAEAAP
jgi:hypothetical protein